MIRNLSLLLLLGCTQESNFQKIQDYNATPADTSEQVVEELPPQTEEETEECPDRIWSATEVNIDESCKDEPEQNVFVAVLDWKMDSFAEFPEYTRHYAPPIVGQLTDDNADGVVDDLDIPDIVVVSGDLYYLRPGVLRLISGDGSVVHWSKANYVWNGVVYNPIQHSTPAIGDVDLDGEPEILTLLMSEDKSSCHFARIDTTGALEVFNDAETVACKPHSISLSDMDGDGSIEVISGNTIFNAEDGSIQGQGNLGTADTPYWVKDKAFAVDLDGDGVQELVTGNTIYDPWGNTLCITNSFDGFPAAADLDGDGYGEIIVSGRGSIQIYDHNCMPVLFWPLTDTGNGGPPTIADYDGDGEPEIGVASYDYYFVFEADGTLLWQNPVDDSSSNCTGSSVYDFEGDGYAEVVYADENDLWVYSGYDGFVKLKDDLHVSSTGTEYPVIVDVDGDGEVEILAGDNNGIRVIGSSDGSWVPARTVWNQYAYHITNVNDDLTIPSPTPVNWPEYNNFRSADTRLNNGDGALFPDAFPLLLDTCELECEQGVLQVVLQMGNQGLTEFPAGIPISVYAEVAGERVLLQTQNTENLIISGRSNPGMVFTLSPDDVPEGKMWVVVDDDGAGGSMLDECNEDNNEMLIESGLCQ